MTTPWPAIAGIALSLLMSGEPAQLPVIETPPQILELVASYRRLIENYRRGDEKAVDAVIALPRNDLDSILKVIFGVPDMPWAKADDLRGAAMLHTDAALRIVGPDEEDGPRRRHLAVAGRMVHAAGPRDDPFLPRWYFAVSRAWRERGFFQVAEDFLGRGRTLVPGNPTILYESATLAETLAQGYLPVHDGAVLVNLIEQNIARNVLRRSGLLNDAAGWLREAVERDDTMLMARLHLGRVETLRGREREGLVHLERVRTVATDDAAAYLAAIFSGAANERLRRLDAAEASYRHAMTRFPDAQAAWVALSELLQRSGKTGDSRTVLHGLLLARTGPTREPWWFYLADPPGLPDERLGALRREVRY